MGLSKQVRVRLQYSVQFCVVTDQVPENHEAGLKSKGISANMYLEFFGFAFLGAYHL